MYKEFERKMLILTLIRTLIVSFFFFAPMTQAADEFLDPGLAFKFSAKMLDAKTIAITYVIADGYYMYRERFSFKAEDAELGAAALPPGKRKFDETFQKNVETYRNSVTITLPVETKSSFTLHAISQGCADQGLCYAPQEASVKLDPAVKSVPVGARKDANTETGALEASLKSRKFLVIIPLFLLLGLGLAFTPCVLPMVPILSSIIVGEGVQVSRTRGFSLAATYSMGMALVYTALGIAAGLVGEGLSAALQNTWALVIFGALIALLSLSMFGVYNIRIPATIQTKLLRLSEKQTAGKLIGVFIMGALSALIVSPCIAAPLAGVLLYISQSRDVIVGGGALFAMAIGMSIPLLLIGLSAGSLLPRAGMWMEAVKRFFGVLMLAMALWIVSPVLPYWAQMLGWAALGIGYSGHLLSKKSPGWQSKVLGVILGIAGAIQLVGLASGGRDAFEPLAHLSNKVVKKIEFTQVKSLAELDVAILQSQGKTVMLDFYADWCISCKEMEKFTFADSMIQAKLASVVLLQADVTANNADDKALLKRFKLFGPPGIIFFDRHGKEIPGGRVIGYQNVEKFSQSLNRIIEN